MISSITLDYTSLNTWRTCPQKFAYWLLHGVGKSGSSPALEFGTLVHYGIEQINLLNAVPSAAALSEIDYLIDPQNPPVTTNDWHDPLIQALHLTTLEASKTSLYNVLPDERRSLKHLLLLLVRYIEHYNPDVLRTSKLEVKHKAFLGLTRSGTQVFYSGTLDGLSGRKIIERKTTSYLNSGFIDRINPNAQATGYVYLARDYYNDPTLNQIIFDAISTGGYGKTPGAASFKSSYWKINKDPSSLFMRLETMRTEEQIAEWRAQVLYDCERIVEDISRGRFSTNQPDACTAYNSTCAYIDICRSASNVRMERLSNASEAEPWKSFAINQDHL